MNTHGLRALTGALGSPRCVISRHLRACDERLAPSACRIATHTFTATSKPGFTHADLHQLWKVVALVVRRTTDGDTLEALLALPDTHPYRAVATGSYIPSSCDQEAWLVARPLALRMMADDVALPGHDTATAGGRRSSLCHYLCWLAEHETSRLTVAYALDDDMLRHYLATDARRRRRTSHRSRTTALSQLRSYRAAYPELGSPLRTQSPGDGSLPALQDWEFDLALRQAASFRHPATRTRTRAWLLLARGAGLSGADCRWVSGADVYQCPTAGTWVRVTRPGAERAVPVLARYATALEDLAVGADDRCLVAPGTPPCADEVPSALGSNITRAIRTSGHPTLVVSTERLRKAWIAEHLAANTPLNTLLAAAGLKSLRTIETLVLAHGPARPEAETQLAWELGGITRGEAA